MKNILISSVLVALLSAGTALTAQDYQDEYLGLPGDNLNLYAVMRLFQESKTLEEFERDLNERNSTINNLDLNSDNLVDYIKVIDYPDGNVHNIVLQVPVSRRENQDVAVFTVERFSNGQVQIQLTGDEALYGRNYIIEPFSDATPNPGYTGNTVVTTRFEISAWPVIRFIYLPTYAGWHSSWYWGYYPTYWNPWRPYYWHYYYGYHYHFYNDYYRYYHRNNTHYYTHWNDNYYSSRRSYSPYVSNRIHSGVYKKTYSHPDQRREGEAMFTSLHPEKSRRTQDNYSGDFQGKRTFSEAGRDRQPTGTLNRTTSRSGSDGTNKSVTNQNQGQNSGASRRSSSTTSTPVYNKQTGNSTNDSRRTGNVNSATTNRQTGQNPNDSRKSGNVTNTTTNRQTGQSTNGTGRSGNGNTMSSRYPEKAQNSGTSGRSGSSVSRGTSTHSNEKSASQNRSTGQTRSSGVKPAEKRSSSSKSTETSKKGTTSNTKESGKNSKK